MCTISLRGQQSSYHLYTVRGNFLCGSADKASVQRRASNWISELLLKVQLSVAKLSGREVWILVSWCKRGSAATYASHQRRTVQCVCSVQKKLQGALSRTCVNKCERCMTQMHCVKYFTLSPTESKRNFTKRLLHVFFSHIYYNLR